MGNSDESDRPGPDASAAEIAAWMERDFGRALAEGMANANDDNDDENTEEEGSEDGNVDDVT